MIDAVFFDLDGTLLDRGRTAEHYLRGQIIRVSILRDVDPSAYIARAVQLDLKGYAPRDGLFRALESEFGLLDGSHEVLLDDFRSHFPQECFPYPGLDVTTSELRRRGISIGLITNGSSLTQRRKIERLGIDPIFDVILVSEEEGVSKPSPVIFRRALDAVDATAAESVYVGDDPESDIRGARDAGLRAIWRRNDDCPPPNNADAMIDDLREIPGIIAGW